MINFSLDDHFLVRFAVLPSVLQTFRTLCTLSALMIHFKSASKANTRINRISHKKLKHKRLPDMTKVRQILKAIKSMESLSSHFLLQLLPLDLSRAKYLELELGSKLMGSHLIPQKTNGIR